MAGDVFLGIDLGTSGCRGMAIDARGDVVAEVRQPLPPSRHGRNGEAEQDPADWWQAVLALLPTLAAQCAGYHPRALAIDGTSASLLLTDSDGIPLTPALMYDDSRARAQLPLIAAHAPDTAAVHGASSSLAKLLHLQNRLPAGTRHAVHQAEWITNRLTGRHGVGDENNCLKLGYDPVSGAWPDWLEALGVPTGLLPEVMPVGTLLGPLDPVIARETGLPESLQLFAGTTDSTAAALACGIAQTGDGVTSLGSTLSLKLLSERPVFSPRHGVYSHKVFGRWLAGGASNSGGAVLRHYFDDGELIRLSAQIDPERDSELDYYPLLRPGERFPVSDTDFAPRLNPVPRDRVRFLHGLLEGIARIEQQGYALLTSLGAPPLRRVLTAGGGAGNRTWQRLRHRLLGVPVDRARQDEAAYGAALIARRGYTGSEVSARP